MPSPRSAEDSGGLPRSQSGANPQHVMASLLGDYWLDRDEHLPSTSLVDLVCEFDVTTASARAALSRLLRRGTLHSRKAGRNTFYRLSDSARARLAATRDALISSTTPGPDSWDGTWVVVAFSVSEDRREIRHALRSGLRRSGFGPLYDGVWASPSATCEELVKLLSDLGVEQATILRSSVLHPPDGVGHPRAVWDLDALADGYRDFSRTYGPLIAALGAGKVTPREALRRRAEMLEAWRALTEGEPSLPAALLPSGWPRAEATDVFVQALDGLAPLAEQRFREIVADEAPDLAALASARRLRTSPSPSPDLLARHDRGSDLTG